MKINPATDGYKKLPIMGYPIIGSHFKKTVFLLLLRYSLSGHRGDGFIQ